MESTLDWDKIDCTEYPRPVMFFFKQKRDTSENFSPQDYPINTYAYSITEKQWFVNEVDSGMLQTILWKEIESFEVPPEYLMEITDE